MIKSFLFPLSSPFLFISPRSFKSNTSECGWWQCYNLCSAASLLALFQLHACQGLYGKRFVSTPKVSLGMVWLVSRSLVADFPGTEDAYRVSFRSIMEWLLSCLFERTVVGS